MRIIQLKPQQQSLPIIIIVIIIIIWFYVLSFLQHENLKNVEDIQLEGEELMLPSLTATGLHDVYNNLLLGPLP